jgi:hypothetical protein
MPKIAEIEDRGKIYEIEVPDDMSEAQILQWFLEQRPPDEEELAAASRPATVNPNIEKQADRVISREGYRNPEREAAEAAGVDVSGLPSGVRALASLGTNDQDRNYLLAAARYFGIPPEQVQVRKGPQSGSLEVLNPETGRWTTRREMVNIPTFADLADAAGPAIPLVTGGAGSLVGPATGAAGAAAGEMGRNLLGRALGVNEATTAQMGEESALAALFQLGGDLGATAMMKLYQRMAGGAGLPNISPERFQELYDTLKSKSPEELQSLITSDRVLAQAAAASGERAEGAYLAGRRNATAGEEGKELLAREAEITDAAGQAAGRAIGETIPKGETLDTSVELGRGVQQAAAERTGGNIVEQELADLQARRQRVAEAFSRLAAEAPEDVGAPVREAVDQARKTFMDEADKAYASARAMGNGNNTVMPPVNTLRVAEQYKSQFSRDLFPTLTDEDRKVVESFLGNIRTGPNEIAAADIEQISRALSTLKAYQRDLNSGAFPGRNSRMVNDLVSAMQRDRDALLEAMDPGLASVWRDVDKFYAEGRQRFGQGILGRLLQTKDGRPAIYDEAVFDSVFGATRASRQNSSDIAGVMGPREREMLRQAFISKYQDAIIDPSTGLLKGGRAEDQFLRKYDRALPFFFSPDELQLLRTPARARGTFAREEQRIAQLEKELGGSLEGRTIRMDPSTIFEQTFKGPTGYEDALRIRNLIAGTPQEELYKQLIQRRIRDTAMTEGEGRILGVDPESLLRFVDEYQNPLSVWMGREYPAQLRKMGESLRDFKPPEAVRSDGGRGTISDIIGILTGNPFSDAGVRLRRTLNLSDRSASRMLQQAILDPKMMKQMLDTSYINPRSAAYARALAGMAAQTAGEE